MSLQSWIEKFYPVNIQDIKSDEDAIKHSIKKWEGLQSYNLEKHGVIMNGHYYLVELHDIDKELYDISNFEISSSTCALCYLHIDNCATCPLYKKMGFVCGSNQATVDGWTSLYETGDTSLMLKNLKSLLIEE